MNKSRRVKGTGCVYCRNEWYYIAFIEKGKRKDISLFTKNKKEADKKIYELVSTRELTRSNRVFENLLSIGNSKTDTLNKTQMEISIEKAFDLYLQNPNRPDSGQGTLSNYKHIWEKFQKQLPHTLNFIEEITEKDALEYATSINNLSGSTYNYHTGFLRLLFKTLLPRKDNPFEFIKRKKVLSVKHQALTDTELKRLIGCTSGELKTLFVIGAYSGLRLLDTLNLTYEQIKDDCIVLKPAKTSKYGTLVQIPLHNAIKSRLELNQHKTGYVMPALKELSRDKLAKQIKTIFVEAGFQTLEDRDGGKRKACLYGFHSLRHTFVSMMANSGVPLALIGKMTGHSSERMTAHYFAANSEALKKAIESI